MTTHLMENIALKRYLVLQSFAPLFALLLIKHIGHFDLIAMFFSRIFKGDWSAFALAIHSSSLGNVVVSMLCTLWLIVTFVVAAAFRGFQRVDFDHHGEVIVIGEEKKDSGVTFLVSFVLPLLVDDVGTLRGFIFFIALLAMVIVLLMRSDLFYQNPVLAALKYKTYEFTFSSPYNDVEAGKTYIGISGCQPSDEAVVEQIREMKLSDIENPKLFYSWLGIASEFIRSEKERDLKLRQGERGSVEAPVTAP